MVKVEGCAGSVEICDPELDGNLGALLIGGGHGDTEPKIERERPSRLKLYR